MQSPSPKDRSCYPGRTLFAVVSFAGCGDNAAACGHEPEAFRNPLYCVNANPKLVKVQAGLLKPNAFYVCHWMLPLGYVVLTLSRPELVRSKHPKLALGDLVEQMSET